MRYIFLLICILLIACQPDCTEISSIVLENYTAQESFEEIVRHEVCAIENATYQMRKTHKSTPYCDEYNKFNSSLKSEKKICIGASINCDYTITNNNNETAKYEIIIKMLHKDNDGFNILPNGNLEDFSTHSVALLPGDSEEISSELSVDNGFQISPSNFKCIYEITPSTIWNCSNIVENIISTRDVIRQRNATELRTVCQ